MMAEGSSQVSVDSPQPVDGPRASIGNAPEGPRETPKRIHYLDWLRVLALFGVFLYHAVHPFDTMDWHVKNAE